MGRADDAALRSMMENASRRLKCPHCRTAINVGWTIVDIGGDSEVALRRVHWTNCPDCGRTIIRLTTHNPASQTFAYPTGAQPRPVPKEVPAPFASDFREACLTLSDSPKASAAISRRCLQHVIREKAGITKENLAAEIDELLESGRLPGPLAESVDAVRNIGNFAAHPIKSTNTGEVIDVEPGEAEWLLDVLADLFDFYFVQPEITKARRAALNEKLKEAGKPPIK